MKINIVKLAALGLLLAPLSAQAIPVVYDWTGTCTTGCTGQATATLTLADTYTVGTFTTNVADFISWEFTSDAFSYSQFSVDNFFFSPVFFSMIIGTDGVFFDNTVGWFAQSTDGTGSEFGGTVALRASRPPLPIPAPGTLALLGFGLVGAGFGRKRIGHQVTSL